MRFRAERGYALDAKANLLLLRQPRACESAHHRAMLITVWEWLQADDQFRADATAAAGPSTAGAAASPAPGNPAPVPVPLSGRSRSSRLLPAHLAPPAADSPTASSAPPAAAASLSSLDGAISLLARGETERTQSSSGLPVYWSEGRARLMLSFGWEVTTEALSVESSIDKLEAEAEYVCWGRPPPSASRLGPLQAGTQPLPNMAGTSAPR